MKKHQAKGYPNTAGCTAVCRKKSQSRLPDLTGFDLSDFVLFLRETDPNWLIASKLPVKGHCPVEQDDMAKKLR